ncbi:hypothetical protein LzC2_22910 [Planctomycetes bacterium LzC2]|uniref:Uncharacterized protein n=1 Tax=Alienimonas chondri TaxID=2681879 RepID=A0ABX1VFD1_9PLAN|nr:hypothetical protein [Alienimonas chondri]
MGEHREGDVPIPAVPAPDLVFVQTRLLLGLFEALLDRPAGAGDLRQFLKRGPLRRTGQIIGRTRGRQTPARSGSPEPTTPSGRRVRRPVPEPPRTAAPPSDSAARPSSRPREEVPPSSPGRRRTPGRSPRLSARESPAPRPAEPPRPRPRRRRRGLPAACEIGNRRRKPHRRPPSLRERSRPTPVRSCCGPGPAWSRTRFPRGPWLRPGGRRLRPILWANITRDRSARARGACDTPERRRSSSSRPGPPCRSTCV